MSYRVHITKSARSQIVENARYIAEASRSLEVAQRWLESVFDAAYTAAEFPRRCALADENDVREYEIRRLLIGNYLLLFTVVEEDQMVVVLGLRHGSRLPRADELPDVNLSGEDS
jgi:toxin ParE1/3/4